MLLLKLVTFVDGVWRTFVKNKFGRPATTMGMHLSKAS